MNVNLHGNYAPIHSLTETLTNTSFAYVAGILGILTLISLVNSGVLASSRFPFAMAKDKLLPNSLPKDPKY